MELVQTHLAEYQALTTRNTYWIVIQSALWPALFVLLGLIVNATEVLTADQRLWAAVLAIEIIVSSYYAALSEALVSVLYIESELRREIAKHLLGSPFWMWEAFLAHRSPVGKSWNEYTPIIGTVAFFLWAARTDPLSSTSSRIGVVVAFVVLMPMIWLAYSAKKTKQELQKAALVACGTINPDSKVAERSSPATPPAV
jgi:hypothetical protein